MAHPDTDLRANRRIFWTAAAGVALACGLLAASSAAHAQSVSAEMIDWTHETAVREFRGLGDVDQDYNAQGVGKLNANDDVAAMVRAIESQGPAPAAQASTLVAAK